ncbi:hypothetical protein ACP4OV_017139 [Aristida adscensionis]
MVAGLALPPLRSRMPSTTPPPPPPPPPSSMPCFNGSRVAGAGLRRLPIRACCGSKGLRFFSHRR